MTGRSSSQQEIAGTLDRIREEMSPSAIAWLDLLVDRCTEEGNTWIGGEFLARFPSADRGRILQWLDANPVFDTGGASELQDLERIPLVLLASICGRCAVYTGQDRKGIVSVLCRRHFADEVPPDEVLPPSDVNRVLALYKRRHELLSAPGPDIGRSRLLQELDLKIAQILVFHLRIEDIAQASSFRKEGRTEAA